MTMRGDGAAPIDPMRAAPGILLGSAAYARHAGQLVTCCPQGRWLLSRDDGAVVDPAGAPGSLDDATVAWATADLYDSTAVRSFFTNVRRATSLRWLQSAAAGSERNIYAELHDRDVRITLSHSSTTSIAEFVIRSVLDCFQHAASWRDAAARHEWRRHEFREVAGTTWLIYGFGHIGAAVASRAAALGARIIGVRRSVTGDSSPFEVIAPGAALEAVPSADVVVLCAPLTPATQGLVDETFLAAMPQHSVLVNVSRGGLVVQDALVPALDRGRPAWAVLDTFETEPLPADEPLWDHPRAVITPHASGMGSGRLERSAELFTENLRRWMAGEPLLNETVNPRWATTAASLGAPR